VKKKEIRCYTHHSLDGGWADVWITYDDRRRKSYFAPTLLTRASVERDLDIARACAAQNPDLDFSSDIQHNLSILEDLGVKVPCVITTECGEGIPSIHTAAEELSRPEAEAMLTHFLRYRGVRAPLRFSWNKPGIMVHPV
jgi:hypothetical protein